MASSSSPMGLSGICSDSQDLYVMTAGKILRYRLSDWKLLDEVELPDLPPPPSSPPEKTNPTSPPRVLPWAFPTACGRKEVFSMRLPVRWCIGTALRT